MKTAAEIRFIEKHINLAKKEKRFSALSIWQERLERAKLENAGTEDAK